MDRLEEISEIKIFALEVLDVFDELAKPEIKSGVMSKVWNFLKGRTFKIILRKPDAEINAKLRKVHLKLNQRFKDMDNSIEINEMEKINPGVRIPDVGDLGRVKKLMASDEEVLKELGL